jgi:uncharacterized DUF497 family protein
VARDWEFELQGIHFAGDADKARSNLARHGVSFEQAAEAFFDPFFRLVDASQNDEARDALLGADRSSRVLYVVHLQVERDRIRLISARRATREERRLYEDG